jgi:hypothetical protein
VGFCLAVHFKAIGVSALFLYYLATVVHGIGRHGIGERGIERNVEPWIWVSKTYLTHLTVPFELLQAFLLDSNTDCLGSQEASVVFAHLCGWKIGSDLLEKRHGRVCFFSRKSVRFACILLVFKSLISSFYRIYRNVQVAFVVLFHETIQCFYRKY